MFHWGFLVPTLWSLAVFGCSAVSSWCKENSSANENYLRLSMLGKAKPWFSWIFFCLFSFLLLCPSSIPRDFSSTFSTVAVTDVHSTFVIYLPLSLSISLFLVDLFSPRPHWGAGQLHLWPCDQHLWHFLDGTFQLCNFFRMTRSFSFTFSGINIHNLTGFSLLMCSLRWIQSYHCNTVCS